MNPAPTVEDELLSPEWLTQALSPAFPGAVVESIEIVERIVTQCTKLRLIVRWKVAPPATPTQFCLKAMMTGDIQRVLNLRSSEIEASFYNELAGQLSLRLARCRYAGIDHDTHHGAIIMDDLVAGGARFLSALSPYTPDQVAGSLDQLARVHAFNWGGENLERFAWLPRRVGVIAERPMLAYDLFQELLDGHRGTLLPPDLRSAERIHGGVAQLSERTKAMPYCLVHGDSHAGNVFETAEGPGFVDWQMFQRGCWAVDVAYHVGAALTVGDRRASERDLLRHYLERLRAHGVEPPLWDDAWTEYRAHVVYGFYMWAITRKVAPEITYEFVKRLGTAVVDHDTFRLLAA